MTNFLKPAALLIALTLPLVTPLAAHANESTPQLVTIKSDRQAGPKIVLTTALTGRRY